MQARASERLSATSRLLENTQKAQVEREIEKLRTRIAAIEKVLGIEAL